MVVNAKGEGFPLPASVERTLREGKDHDQELEEWQREETSREMDARRAWSLPERAERARACSTREWDWVTTMEEEKNSIERGNCPRQTQRALDNSDLSAQQRQDERHTIDTR
eukprot:c28147_g3_i1 orf=561-896(-)